MDEDSLRNSTRGKRVQILLGCGVLVLLAGFTSAKAVTPQIANAGSHVLVLRDDGTVWAWGANHEGQLGDGTRTSRDYPAPVPGLSGVVSIAARRSVSLVAKSDGTVWQWGNYFGMLSSDVVPNQVLGITDVVSVATNGDFSFALKNDGTVWRWAMNTVRLVDGTFRREPVQVSALTNVFAIAASSSGGLALKADGTVWQWEDYPNLTVPVQVTGLSNVVQIAAGHAHKLALKSDGTVWAWGDNSDGQLGDGTQVSTDYPVQVMGLSNATLIATGTRSSYAKTSDGKLWAWGGWAWSGWPQGGFLGDGTAAESAPNGPVLIDGVINPVSIAASNYDYNSSIAVLQSNGTVLTWGSPAALGMGLVPAGLPGIPALTDVTSVAAGDRYVLALKGDGTVWAWGWNGNGQLGDGTLTLRATPKQIAGLQSIVQLTAGATHSMALDAEGSVWTWGSNGSGQLGDGGYADRATPARLNSLSSVVAITAARGGTHSLALKMDGTVWAWGSNQYGELGDGSNVNRSVPVQVAGLSGIIAIAAGNGHSLAMNSDGVVMAWGRNAYGQLGDGTTTDQPLPIAISVPAGITSIAAGDFFSLAVTSDGSLWVWGDNSGAQLSGMFGGGTSYNQLTPTLITTLNGVAVDGVLAAAGGYSYSVALTNDGNIWALGIFGKDPYIIDAISTPGRRITTEGGFISVTASVSNIVAVKADGTVRVWGTSSYGEWGHSGRDSFWLPAPVSFAPGGEVFNAYSSAQYVGDTQSPTAPQYVTATAVNGWRIDLSWSASSNNAGVVQYRIYRDGSLVRMLTGATLATSYVDSGLPASTTNRYSIQACDAAANCSAQTASVPVTTLASALGNLTATTINHSQIDLSWSAFTEGVEAPQFRIYRNGALLTTVTGAPPATRYSDADLTASTTYSYTVRLCDAQGYCTAQSASASATTPARTIRVPQEYSSIQEAIDASDNGDTILVAPGTYFENIDFKGKGITVKSEAGSMVTVIDGNSVNSVVRFVTGEGPSSVLEGFTLRNGRHGDGGGIRINGASPTIRSNVIANNRACWGAGISIAAGSPLIQKNVISGNTHCGGGVSGGGGGGISASGNAQIIENVISHNAMTDSHGGGGIWLNSAALILGNVITANSVSSCGGGIYTSGIETHIIQNVVARNTANCGGGIYFVSYSVTHAPLLANNTVVDNDALFGSGVMLGELTNSQAFVNNIVAGKPGQSALRCSNLVGTTPAPLQSNDIYAPFGLSYQGLCADATGSSGNISVDPRFVDRAHGNYRIRGDSPAVDSGTNGVSGLPATDIEGNLRVLDGDGNAVATLDMGAYEFTPFTPGIAVTPDAYDFGALAENAAPVARTVTIANTGTAALSVSAAMLGTRHPASFAIAPAGPNPCSTLTPALAPGTSCTLVVTFTPEVAGTYSADLIVVSDAIGSPTVIPLTATVGSTDVDTTPDPVGLTAQDTPFPDTLVTSNTITVTGINVPVPIGIGLYGTVAQRAEYSIDGGPFTNQPGTVVNGQTVTARVLTPPDRGWPQLATATLSIGSSYAVFSIPVLPTPVLKLSKTNFYLGSVGVGASSGAQTVSLKNIGPADLNFDAITVTGTGFSKAVDTCTGKALPALQSGLPESRATITCTVGVSFTPLSPGFSSGVLTIWDNTAQSPHVIPLVGIGAPAESLGVYSAVAFSPLIDNATWSYTTNGTSSYTVTALPGTALYNGAQVKRLKYSGESVNYVTNDANGFRAHGFYDPSVFFEGYGSAFEYDTYDPPVKVLEAEFSLGQAVTTMGTVTSTLTASGEFSFSLSYTATGTPVAFEIVTVPAGAFRALRVDSSLHLSGQIESLPVDWLTQGSSWFVESLGSVKDVSTTTDGTTTSTDTTVLTGSSLLLTSPGLLSISPAGDATPGGQVISDSIAVRGINAGVPISITGGEYSIDGGAWTGSPGTVFNGQSVSVRETASSSYGTTTNATLTIGGESAVFAVTTVAPPSQSVTVMVSGSGTVTSSPSGMNCSDTCTASYGHGMSVTLTATPAPNYVFSGWSGACTGAGGCVLTMESARNVTASFTQLPDTLAPSLPQGLTVVAEGPDQIKLRWSAASDNFAVTRYRLYRDGALVATLGPATGYRDGGLSASTWYSYAVAACDAAGNCSAPSAAALANTLVSGQYAYTLDLERDWNLLGNSLDVSIDVAAVFGDQDSPVAGITENVASLWKWNALTERWAFYSPQLTGAEITSYAANHNYEVLATIEPGEGYWVNAIGPISLPAQSGSGFDWSAPSFSALPSSWNLIAGATSESPRRFNTRMSLTPPAPGAVPEDNFVSMWAWNSAMARWYFYAPSLESSAGLEAVRSHAMSRGYLHFEDFNRKLGVGSGFWVNRP